MSVLTKVKRDVQPVGDCISAQTPGSGHGVNTSSAEGLASLVKGEVPQEHTARPVDGPPEMALNCEALILKAKATAREPIRTPRLLSGGVSEYACLNYVSHKLEDSFYAIVRVLLLGLQI